MKGSFTVDHDGEFWRVYYGFIWTAEPLNIHYRTRTAARYAARALNEAEKLDRRTVAKSARVGQKGKR